MCEIQVGIYTWPGQPPCEMSLNTCIRRQAQQWNVWWFKVTLAFWLIVLSMHHRVIPGLSASCPKNPSHQATMLVFLLLLLHSRSSCNNYILWKFWHTESRPNPLNPHLNHRVRPYLPFEWIITRVKPGLAKLLSDEVLPTGKTCKVSAMRAYISLLFLEKEQCSEHHPGLALALCLHS